MDTGAVITLPLRRSVGHSRSEWTGWGDIQIAHAFGVHPSPPLRGDPPPQGEGRSTPEAHLYRYQYA